MAYSLYDVTLDSDVIGQILNINHNAGLGVTQGFGSGQSAPAAIFQSESPHSTSLRSTDLETILALNSNAFINSGLPVLSATSSIPFRLRSSAAKFASGASHIALQCSNTLFIPDSISGVIGQAAVLEGTIRYIGSDSFTIPVSKASSQTLSDASFVNEYILHSVSIAGSGVSEVQSVNINPGIRVLEQRDGGGPFLTDVFIVEVVPTIEIFVNDIDAVMDTIDSTTLGAGVIIYFAQRAASSDITAVGSSAHISVTASSGLRQASTISGDARSNLSGSIMVHPLALTASVGIAIS